MKTLISIDPGLSSGVIAGTYSDEEPFRVTHAFQIEGGVEGFLESVWHFEGASEIYYGNHKFLQFPEGDPIQLTPESWTGRAQFIVEKFTARSVSAGGFSYRTRDLEPLRVEGAILALGIEPQWMNPAQQYILGGKSLQEKLKNRNAWLKEHAELGYYLTGKSVGQGDANDARSALSHCISWLRRNKHQPTLELFRNDKTPEATPQRG